MDGKDLASHSSTMLNLQISLAIPPPSNKSHETALILTAKDAVEGHCCATHCFDAIHRSLVVHQSNREDMYGS
jgi:hypothetical protein